MRLGVFKTKDSFQKAFKEKLKKTYYKDISDLYHKRKI